MASFELEDLIKIRFRVVPKYKNRNVNKVRLHGF